MNTYARVTRCARWLAGIAIGLATFFILGAFARSQIPPPHLVIVQTGSNRFQLHITNGIGYANYEIYRRERLESFASAWTPSVTGRQGQVVFHITNFATRQEYFQAVMGNDWDLDGVPNWQDSQPTNIHSDRLQIVIDSPGPDGTVP